MPGGSGTELLRVVRDRYPELDVIMITAVVDIDVALRAIRNGASDYLTKPFNLEQVKITVERALEKRRLDHREPRVPAPCSRRKVEERDARADGEEPGGRDALLRELQETYQDDARSARSRRSTCGTRKRRGTRCASSSSRRRSRSRSASSEPELTEIRRGALLHDVGKIGIPDAILRKPGEADPEEWEVMRTASRVSATRCWPGSSFSRHAARHRDLRIRSGSTGPAIRAGCAARQIPSARASSPSPTRSTR